MTLPSRPISRSEKKRVTSLSVKKYRTTLRQTIAEGEALVREALASPWSVLEVLATGEWLASSSFASLAPLLSQRGVELRSVDTETMQQISDVKTSPGICAIVSPPELPGTETFDGITLALDQISDPVNLGAIARSACFYGIKRLILSEGCADPLNPKAIRASMGGLFNLPTHSADSLEYELKRLKLKKLPVVIANANAGEDFLPNRIASKCIAVIGSEAHGIRPEIIVLGDVHWHLTAVGRDLTLNAAAAATVMFDHLNRTLSRG